jgi:hypothetical protein
MQRTLHYFVTDHNSLTSKKPSQRPLQAIPQQVIIVGYVHALSSYIGLDTKIGWHANN